MQNTQRTFAVKPTSASSQNACLINIYPTGPDIGKRVQLEDKPLVIGRDSECDICLADSSVSRKHLQIQPSPDGYYAEDLHSTNGTFINDQPITRALLKDGDYLRLGSSIFRFLSGGNVEAEYHQVIYRLSIMDALTEVYNKRYLMEFLDRELVRSARHNRPLSVVILDLDHFKSINDQHGHLGGDYTLRELASRIKKTVRKDELFARYGGEEFIIVLPETDTAGAVAFAERVRNLIAETPFEYEGVQFTVTASLGVASCHGDPHMTTTRLLQLADEKLYQAKREGRNRVVS